MKKPDFNFSMFIFLIIFPLISGCSSELAKKYTLKNMLTGAAIGAGIALFLTLLGRVFGKSVKSNNTTEVLQSGSKLPSILKCPNCGEELELEEKERKERIFTCPECNNLIDMNIIDSNDAKRALTEKEYEYRCVECHTDVRKEDKICPKCGNNLEEEYECAECHADVKKEDKFCPECGANLED